MRKKISELIRELFERSRLRHHRSIIVVIGDRAKDQVINLYNLWLTIREKNAAANQAKPKILWCYKNELGFSSHQHKRRKELTKKMKQGLYESESDNPFELFLTSADIRFCYYKDTQSILGSTYDVLLFQDFESLTANILCRTIETVGGGGVVFFMLKSMQSLQQLYSLSMDVHNRYKTDAFGEIQPHFNERMMLSLVVNDSVLFMDDELNMIQQGAAGQAALAREASASGVTDEIAQSLQTAEKNRKDLIASLETNKVIHGILSLTKTIDQAKVVLFLLDSTINRSLKSNTQSLSSLLNQNQKAEVVFVSAGRGRGKSAALGLSIAGALASNVGNIAITAATPENVKTVFEFIVNGLEVLGYRKNNDYSLHLDESGNPKSLTFIFVVERTEHKNMDQKAFHYNKLTVTYTPPDEKVDKADLLIIDEAAAIPLVHVKSLVSGTNCPVFISSTIHGYEGSGRSLSLKLIEELRKGQGGVAARSLKEVEMTIPIRYSVLDPIENWLHSFLCLDSTTAVPLKSALPHPKECSLFFVSKATLFSYHKSSEQFLKNMWSLFVGSHYKNSPNDLQLLADAPSHFLAVLLGPIDKTEQKASMPDILAAIQFCFEGGIKDSTAEANALRGLKPSGDLVPWSLSEQFLDRSLFNIMGARIVRIATHPNATRMGYGARAIQLLKTFFSNEFLDVESKVTWKSFASSFGGNVSADNQNLDSQIQPRRQLPSLLKNASEILPPQIEYLAVSFGLTKELFHFWDKCGFKTVHLKQTKNDITGENNAIMLTNIGEAKVNFDFFTFEFRRRFACLLSTDFRTMELFTALQILKPNLSTSESAEPKIDLDVTGGISSEQMFLALFTSFDLARLEAYSNNAIEFYIIKDLLQRIAELYFLGKFGAETKLSLAQAAILLGLGLQVRTVEEVASILKVDNAQVLALYNKSIKKFTLKIKEIFEGVEAKRLNLEKDAGLNIQTEETKILKEENEDLVGGLRKRQFAAKAIKGSKRVKTD